MWRGKDGFGAPIPYTEAESPEKISQPYPLLWLRIHLPILSLLWATRSFYSLQQLFTRQHVEESILVRHPWMLLRMTPKWFFCHTCIFKPDSLRERNSLNYQYHGVFWSNYPSGHSAPIEATGKGEKQSRNVLDLKIYAALDVEKVALRFNLIHNKQNKPFLRKFSYDNH